MSLEVSVQIRKQHTLIVNIKNTKKIINITKLLIFTAFNVRYVDKEIKTVQIVTKKNLHKINNNK